MLDLTQDIDSMSNFKRTTRKYLDRMRDSGEPLVLTVNGKAEFVVQAAAAYQRLLESRERLEAIEGIQRGLASMERGEGRSLADVDADLRRTYRIARDA